MTHVDKQPDAKLLVVSLHKSGTNLIANLVRSLGYKPFGQGIGDSYAELNRLWLAAGRSFDEFTEYPDDLAPFIFERRQPPIAAFVHRLRSHAAIADDIRDGRLPTLFNYRDPRDVLISEIHYLISTPPPFSWELAESAALKRLPAGKRIPYCLEHWRDYFGETFAAHEWLLQHKHVCSCSYEQLVGRAGGGDDVTRHKIVAKVMAYLRCPGEPSRHTRGLYDTSVRTFRAGRIGGWRDSFSPECINLFAKRYGNVLDLYGFPRT